MTRKRKPHWNGHAPKDDNEAREIIFSAAQKVASQYGIRKTNIKRVADELGITRQTVYRLFPSSDDLLTQISVETGGKILDRLLKHAYQFKTFEDRVVESMIFLARNIPKDEFLKQYFVPQENEKESIGEAFSRDALDYGFQMLKAIYPENSKRPVDEKWLKKLAEHQQRILLSMIIAPSESIKTVNGMRDYLNAWLRPLLNIKS